MKIKIPVLENVSVHYTLHGVPAKSIHLNENLAKEYIARMNLRDAVINNCYRFEEIDDEESEKKE